MHNRVFLALSFVCFEKRQLKHSSKVHPGGGIMKNTYAIFIPDFNNCCIHRVNIVHIFMELDLFDWSTVHVILDKEGLAGSDVVH